MSNDQPTAASSVPARSTPELGGYGVLDSVMPVVLFLGLNRWLGPAWAIGAVTLWSIKVMVSRRRRGLTIGRWYPLLVLLVVARGAVGIITDSEAVYFGIGIGTKFAIGVGLIATVLVGKPFVGRVAPLMFAFDEETIAHPRYRRVTAQLTVLAALFEIVTATWDIWLWNQTSADGYVLIRFLVSWPLGMLFFIGGFLWADRALKAIPGFPGMLPLLEAAMESQQAQKLDGSTAAGS